VGKLGMFEKQQHEMYKWGLEDFVIIVEESFVHNGFVTGVIIMFEENKSGRLRYRRGLVDFGIVVEENFWHEEYVTGSTIVIEEIFVKISQEDSHADKKSAMQSAMQKSAMKEQPKFQEGNIAKIQNTHQVEMGSTNKFVKWVEMVTTKLV
jgi:hypothetical protein